MTDHAAEARSHIDLWSDIPFPDDDDQEQARQHLDMAQVHATLALAEEQRTANLLALVAFRASKGTTTGLDSEALLSVFARLGLTPTTPNQEQNR